MSPQMLIPRSGDAAIRGTACLKIHFISEGSHSDRHARHDLVWVQMFPLRACMMRRSMIEFCVINEGLFQGGAASQGRDP